MLSLCSFNCVINRPGLRTVLSEKFLEVFGWFETELENVQKIYESQKVIETCTRTTLEHFIVIAESCPCSLWVVIWLRLIFPVL